MKPWPRDIISEPEFPISEHRKHCEGKQIFKTKSAARLAAKRIGAHAYECRDCGNYHFSRQKERLHK